MVSIQHWLAFLFIALGMVLTPGPNMIYLISRSICQGKKAGMISLIGVATGFVFYMLCAVLGITAMLMAVPLAYDILRIAGALYLLYLAWQALKPNGKSIFEVKDLPKDSNTKLFTMGFITNLLNPKIAIMYFSLLPQFIDAKQGDILLQSLTLGCTQIVTSVVVNFIIILGAAKMASFLTEKPLWSRIQRWVMGTVLSGMAIKILLDSKR